MEIFCSFNGEFVFVLNKTGLGTSSEGGSAFILLIFNIMIK